MFREEDFAAVRAYNLIKSFLGRPDRDISLFVGIHTHTHIHTNRRSLMCRQCVCVGQVYILADDPGVLCPHLPRAGHHLHRGYNTSPPEFDSPITFTVATHL